MTVVRNLSYPSREGAVRVAVVDPISSVCRALTNAFAEAGFEPFEPPDLEAWVASCERGGVVMSLLGEAERQRMMGLRDSSSSYNQNLWIAHLSGGAAYLPR